MGVWLARLSRVPYGSKEAWMLTGEDVRVRGQKMRMREEMTLPLPLTLTLTLTLSHGRPSVPESAKGCQGVLASMGDHGRPGATRGDQGRPVAPLLGTRSSYASSALQRSPAVAHGRPWSPIGTRECQGVPGGSGFNGRPWATRGDQWGPIE